MTAKLAIDALFERALRESPQDLPDTDFGWLDTDANKGELGRLRALGGARIDTLMGFEIWSATDPMNELTSIYAFDPKVNHLAFQVTVDDETVKSIGKAAVQVALWRSPEYAPGLPRAIFWKHVFTRHDCAVSDVGQTRDGRTFWRDRISEGLKKGLKVGLVNTDNGRTFEINSIEQYSRMASLAYGQDDRYASFRFFLKA